MTPIYGLFIVFSRPLFQLGLSMPDLNIYSTTSRLENLLFGLWDSYNRTFSYYQEPRPLAPGGFLAKRLSLRLALFNLKPGIFVMLVTDMHNLLLVQNLLPNL